MFKRITTVSLWALMIWIFIDYGYLVKTKRIIEIERYCSAQNITPKGGNSPGLPLYPKDTIRVRAWPFPAFEDIYYPDGCF